MYNIHGTGKLLNVKQAFQVSPYGEAQLDHLIEERGWKELHPDDRVEEIRDYVNRRMSYQFDSESYGKAEFWADPYTIWARKVDDCDGYAVLIAYLCWRSDIEETRLRVVAGNVENDGTTFGHAYVIYRKHADECWYTVEGPFKKAEANRRWNAGIPHNNAESYKKFWWCTTKSYSWSQHDLTIRHGIR
jgi:hypothetical protein